VKEQKLQKQSDKRSIPVECMSFLNFFIMSHTNSLYVCSLQTQN